MVMFAFRDGASDVPGTAEGSTGFDAGVKTGEDGTLETPFRGDGAGLIPLSLTSCSRSHASGFLAT